MTARKGRTLGDKSFPDKIIILYLAKEYGGGGRYTDSLVDALATIGMTIYFVSFFSSLTLTPADCGHVRVFRYPPTFGGWIGVIRFLAEELKQARRIICVAMDHRSIRLASIFRILFPTAHWVYFLQSSLHMKEDRLRRLFRRFIFMFIKGICCVSEHVYETLRQTGYRKDACVVYSAAPAAPLGLLIEMSRELSRKNVVLLAGRMVEGKGHEDLLWAALDHDWTIWFAGDGILRQRLQDKCSTGKQKVRFLGWIDDMSPIYSGSTVVVFPSYCEALGLVVMEAMATGCPVVAYDIEPVRELIKNGVTGLLVPLGDIEALGLAIQGLLDDPERARQIGLRAQKDVRERFTLKRMANDTLRFLEKLRAS